ncbi:hypothetical protein [Bradyrhizobium sp. Ash2021]|uniref:hypothetical protein n=1 Tax=Bradyrhizobium sp. Ash2021 TaxID=2954771 RepID=UPI002815E4E4|nr:hypothetical protein [Bradyrhizobium sp. Ash2021]WMT71786.1 hypothetical protein NL528_27345 [Bradyrhizobium sp. Ash2021]
MVYFRNVRVVIGFAICMYPFFDASSCNAASVGNSQSDTVICQGLDSAKIAKETRGRLSPPGDCAVLPKASWQAVVLLEGGDFYYLAVQLQDGEYRKVWAAADQLYPIYPVNPGANNAGSWREMINAQIQRCWKKPAGDTPLSSKATIIVRLKRDGTLDGIIYADEVPRTPYLRAFQENAMRAITECQPYKLPAANFDEWKFSELTFAE